MLQQNFTRGIILMITNENVSIPEELVKAIEELTLTFSGIKDKVKQVIEIAKKHDFPNFLLRDLIAKSLEKRELSTRSITYYLPPELKRPKNVSTMQDTEVLEKHRTKNQLEQTSSSDTENEDIGDVTENKSITSKQTYDYESQKSENKIRFVLQQENDSLRKQLEEKEGINELLNREIEASKNQKFEARIVDIEELNKNLRVENEQLRHALTKHSFETASEIAIDPELVKNLEHMISHLEAESKAKQKVIEELNAKIQSFSHLDRVVEHQPLEFDLTEKAGFLNQVFSFRYRKCKVIHDGKKVTNITPGVIE
jgi:hypothetical protein